ncbi:MAG TPA: monovalent cation/H+ antiporter subunit D family protein [Gammaproteobacteria bacterium]
MIEHLPILQVIIPLMAAPACLVIDRPRLVWAFALAIGIATLAISVLLLQQVTSDGVISYALGGWDAPWGIEYRIDLLNAYVLLIVSAINVLALIPAYRSVKQEVGEQRQVYFYTLYLLCFAGLLGITATGDAFNVFVFLEISSLSTYALIALGKDRRALWAAYQYLIIGTIGASFILIGIGLLYAQTGTLNMIDLANRIVELPNTRVVLAALVFIVVGICIKLALFPLHVWLPNAYAYAPSIVTVFVAATATKVAIYLLIRFIYSIFIGGFPESALPLQVAFIVLGVAGIFVASLVAIYQTNIKRLFAYSSVAQIGYIIVGLGLGTAIGLQASLLHVFNHALMKGAIFLGLAAVMFKIGGVDLDDLAGLGRRMPWTMAAIVGGGLSLIGVPLTVGFISKWYLILGAIDAGMWPLAVLLVAGSLLAVIYVWRIVETAYFRPAAEGGDQGRAEAPLSFLLPLWLLLLANVYFGIDTSLTVSLSEAASNYLIGSGTGN